MTREELEELSKNELVEHAKGMGVSVEALDKKGTMIDKILGEHKADAKSVVAKKDAPLPPTGGLYTLQGEKVHGKRYKVKIFATESDKGDVPIIVNGQNIIVKRGFDVEMDEAYVEVLRNAVIYSTAQDEDGKRFPTMVQKFPFEAIAL